MYLIPITLVLVAIHLFHVIPLVRSFCRDQNLSFAFRVKSQDARRGGGDIHLTATALHGSLSGAIFTKRPVLGRCFWYTVLGLVQRGAKRDEKLINDGSDDSSDFRLLLTELFLWYSSKAVLNSCCLMLFQNVPPEAFMCSTLGPTPNWEPASSSKFRHRDTSSYLSVWHYGWTFTKGKTDIQNIQTSHSQLLHLDLTSNFSVFSAILQFILQIRHRTPHRPTKASSTEAFVDLDPRSTRRTPDMPSRAPTRRLQNPRLRSDAAQYSLGDH